MGITYDSKRNLIVVSSLGGEGYIYRYDIAQDKWIDFTSLQGVDLTSLTYNAVTDSLAGWQIPYGSLCTLSADGQVQNSIPLNERLPEFGYSRTDYGFNQSIRVIANGDNFYLASHADSSPFTPNREGVITKILSYNKIGRAHV